MKAIRLSLDVIVFLLLGVFALLYLFVSLGELNLQSGWEYTIQADFANAGGLTPGSTVELAGVRVGRVTAIALNGVRSTVTISLRKEVPLQEDVIASIQTKGLLGERYISLSPGGSDEMIAAGGKIRETESPIDLPGLMAAYISLRNKAAKARPSTDTP